MKALSLHEWDVSPSEAVAIQQELAGRVVTEGDPHSVALVAGVDVAVGGRDNTRPGRGAAVVLGYPELRPVEQCLNQQDVAFPYIPGLLSFREIPVLLPALAGLRHQPDLLVVDGQGRAHPRRIGLASHLGLLLDIPTIGCAKSRLTGRFENLGEERGSLAQLRDRGEVVGVAVRTRRGVNPVYVSVGHKISLSAAVEWILRLTRGYRLPEPTRLADQAAAGRLVTAEIHR
jgi:deoxyribonuclease V